tara:strand:- start:464 stop:661 length:198 start_codon:yes stop_codon:yes gene_type:complete
MEVIITPETISSASVMKKDMQEIENILKDLKKENLISKSISNTSFILKCFDRGLNEYRKDLSLFD